MSSAALSLISCSEDVLTVILRLHDEANMKQTYSKYTYTTCALSLLHVCFTFTSSCKQVIRHFFHHIAKAVLYAVAQRLHVSGESVTIEE